MPSAESGTPPIAYTSDSAFAAATCPNSNGSSTIGVKKSVWALVLRSSSAAHLARAS